MPDNRYLLRQRHTWFVVVEVPGSLRGKLGRRLKQSLQTRDVFVARARRHRVVADLKDRIEAARRGREGDLLVTEAMEWRALLKDPPPDAVAPYSDYDTAPESAISELLGDRAEALHDAGNVRWQEFLDLAHGRVTPLAQLLDAWLTDGSLEGRPLRPRTVAERRAAVDAFGTWMVTERLPATVEAVTRKVAGRYAASLSVGREPATVIKLLQALRVYWAWLIRRGHVADDRSPWSGQAPRGRKADSGGLGSERPFTDTEVALLLASPPSPLLRDFLTTALLTGMRREEIGRLRVKDCAGGVFVITAGKTAAAVRRVPVHSAVADMLAARCAGRGPEAFLFDLPGTQERRGDAIGKVFTRYRRSLGIQDGTGRRSLVNLHSCRRWFITTAINAGQPPHLVSLVAGHVEGRKGLTLGRYYGGAQDDALRTVVEAVKLPRYPAIATGDAR